MAFCQALAQVLSHSGLEPAKIHNGHVHVADAPAKPIKSVKPATPEISIVVPAFNEEGNLPSLHKRIATTLDSLRIPWELILVNDGSRDGTLKVIGALANLDKRVTGLDLTRNFGHQAAISAGLDYAQGRAIIVMDADLQDPPEVLPEFIQRWREGNDVVYAVRRARPEGLLKRTAYALFYRLMQRIAEIHIPLDAGDFCLMDRRVVDLMTSMPERNRFLRGLRSWVGFRQVGLEYARGERLSGKTNYTFKRLVTLALDGLFSFSFLPLRVISLAGVAISALSILMAVIYTIEKLTVGLDPPGFATTIVSVFFLAGVQLITLGVIGEYVGRIFEEVKRRPLYVVKHVLRRQA